MTACAVFCIFLCFVMGAFGAAVYARGMIGKYELYMESILRYVSGEIDGEDLKVCIDTGVKSEHYERIQRLLDSIKESCEIEYIYIVKPLNTNDTDNMMNVIAGATAYEKEHEQGTLAVFGALTGNAYSAEVAADYLARMHDGGTQITYFSNHTEFGYDYSGLVPVYDDDGAAVAVLAVDISVNDIRRVLMRYVAVICVGMVFLIGIFLTMLYRWLGRHIIHPISKIQAAALGFVMNSHGQEDPEHMLFEAPNIHSGDEIEALSESLVTMADDLKKYMKNLMTETKEKERIGTELQLATQIQADMLPRIFPAFPTRSEFDIFAVMNPAKEVGGDFYDYFFVDDRHFAVVMADVSGKGVPAALFMVIGKTLIKDHTSPGRDLGEVFAEVNDILCHSNNEGLFITAFEGVLDLETGEFAYVNAGHDAPYICRQGGSFALHKVRPGFVLAGMEGISYKAGSMKLDIGDKLFLYTDGVPEATRADNVLYGSGRLERVLKQNSALRPEEIITRVKADVDAFVADAPAFDDITMLCLEYTERYTEREKVVG